MPSKRCKVWLESSAPAYRQRNLGMLRDKAASKASVRALVFMARKVITRNEEYNVRIMAKCHGGRPFDVMACSQVTHGYNPNLPWGGHVTTDKKRIRCHLVGSKARSFYRALPKK